VLPAKNDDLGSDHKGSSSKEGLPPVASIILSMMPQDMAGVSSRLNSLTGGKFSKGIDSAAAARTAIRAAVNASLPTVQEVGNTLTSGVKKASADGQAPHRGAYGMGSW
jgi:hypothetical protein